MNVLTTNATFVARILSGSALTISTIRNCSSLATTSTGSIKCAVDPATNPGALSGRTLTVSGTGSKPLLATDVRYGTLLMGTGAVRSGTSATFAQMYIAPRMTTTAVTTRTGGSGLYGVAAQGRYVYTVNSSTPTLRIFDATIPASPTQVSSTSLSEAAYSVAVQGRYAYVGGATKMWIYDIGQPTAPVLRGWVTIGGGTRTKTIVSGMIVYVADSGGVVNIIDVSNPQNPVVIRSITGLSTMAGIALQGRYLYVSAQAVGMRIYDVSNPRSPVTMGTYSIAAGGYFNMMTVSGRYAYIYDGATGGLNILDVSNPSSITSLYGSATIGSNFTGLTVQGRTLYMGNGFFTGYLYAVDITQPRNPNLLQRISLSGNTYENVIVGRYLYNVSSADQLQVFDLGGAYIQALEAGSIETTSLSVNGDAKVYGNLDLAGSLNVTAPSAFQSLSTGASVLTLASETGALKISARGTNAAPHILFGTGTTFDARLYRSAVNELTTNASFVVQSATTSATQNMFKIITNYSSTNNTVFRVSASGAVYADGPYNSAGADYAEWFMTSGQRLTPGEVVCIDPTKNNTVKRCERSADSNVMGIVSTNPAYIGNVITGADGLIPPGYSLIGLIGQVPANVSTENGVIRPGDSLTAASKPGFARRASAGESTVGVALEAFGTTPEVEGESSDPQEGVVNVLISRRNQSLTVETVEQKVMESIAAMEIEDEVTLMIKKSLDTFDISESVSTEVEKQLQALDLRAQILTIIEERLSEKKEVSADAIAGDASLHSRGGPPSLEIIRRMLAEYYGITGTGGTLSLTGDLSIEGTVRANAIHGTSLRILHDAWIGGTLHAAAIHASGAVLHTLLVQSGATIGGNLTVGGRMLLGSGSLVSMSVSGSTLEIGSLLNPSSLRVFGTLTIQGMATFLGIVDIRGELIVPSKQAGYALIQRGTDSITVRFQTGFVAQPIVTASPNVPVLYAVSLATREEFTIRLAAPAAEDITFSWHALSTHEPLTATNIIQSGSLVAFPVDSTGVPFSSNDVWNACIRGRTLLDDDGNPYSCSRYHTETMWEHPDLHMNFTWNPYHEPQPLLLLPFGYHAVVMEYSGSGEQQGATSSELSDVTNNEGQASSNEMTEAPLGDTTNETVLVEEAGQASASLPLPDAVAGPVLPEPEEELVPEAPLDVPAQEPQAEQPQETVEIVP